MKKISLCLLFLISITNAAVYYCAVGGTATKVDADGDPVELSAMIAPDSIHEDFTRFGAGDTIYMHDLGGVFRFAFTIRYSGTAENPFVIMAAPGTSPIISGSTDDNDPDFTRSHCMFVTGSHVKFGRGIKFQHARDYNVSISSSNNGLTTNTWFEYGYSHHSQLACYQTNSVSGYPCTAHVYRCRLDSSGDDATSARVSAGGVSVTYHYYNNMSYCNHLVHHLNDSRVIMVGDTLRYGGDAGIYLQNTASGVIDSVYIDSCGNNQGDGFNLAANSSVSISNSTIRRCKRWGLYASRACTLSLNNNTFFRTGAYGYSIYSNNAASVITAKNNRLVRSSGFRFDAGKFTVSGSVHDTGLTAAYEVRVSDTNNIIENCFIDSTYNGPAFLIAAECSVKVRNCAARGPSGTNKNFVIPTVGQPYFYNCISSTTDSLPETNDNVENVSFDTIYQSTDPANASYGIPVKTSIAYHTGIQPSVGYTHYFNKIPVLTYYNIGAMGFSDDTLPQWDTMEILHVKPDSVYWAELCTITIDADTAIFVSFDTLWLNGEDISDNIESFNDSQVVFVYPVDGDSGIDILILCDTVSCDTILIYNRGVIRPSSPPNPTINSVSPSSPRLFKIFEATGTNLSNCKLYLNSVSLGTPTSATSTTIRDTALGTTRGFHWLIAEDTLTGMRCSTSSRIYIKNTQLDTVLLGRP